MFNLQQLASIEDARAKIEAWRLDYDARRPHGSLGQLILFEFRASTSTPPKGTILRGYSKPWAHVC
jgi:putative transposase